jgi:hypothetical protein
MCLCHHDCISPIDHVVLDAVLDDVCAAHNPRSQPTTGTSPSAIAYAASRPGPSADGRGPTMITGAPSWPAPTRGRAIEGQAAMATLTVRELADHARLDRTAPPHSTIAAA